MAHSRDAHGVVVWIVMSILYISCIPQDELNGFQEGRITEFTGSSSSPGLISLKTSYQGPDLGQSLILTVCAQQGSEIPQCGCVNPVIRQENIGAGSGVAESEWDTQVLSSSSYSFIACLSTGLGEVKSHKYIRGVLSGSTEGLKKFQCSKSVAGPHGSVDCDLQLPDDVTQIDHIQIRKIDGTTAPHHDCRSNGLEVEVISKLESGTHTVVATQENPVVGATSFIACLRDSNEKLVAVSSSVGVSPKDSQGPPALVSVKGRADTKSSCGGNVSLEVDFPDSTGDFSKVTVRKISGAEAPKDCQSGTVVYTFTNFMDRTIDLTGQGSGALSYRFCLSDEVGNITSGATEIVQNLATCESSSSD